ncbi:MAG: DEAD/DEAH box helicase family protein, partial [Clostridiaceae bacterium]
MGNSLVHNIEDAAKTSFIDKDFASDPNFRPQFLSNNYKEGKKILSTLQEELSKCDEFYISVAFITKGGVTPLLQVLKELEDRGVKGKILTTDYLTFSEPDALVKLNELTNIELKMYLTNNNQEGFHTKGYIFKDAANGIFRIIVGSSNLTMNALTVNQEWNTKIVSTQEGEYAHSLRSEFDKLWNSSNSKSFTEFIYDYETRYRIKEEQKSMAADSRMPSLEKYRLEPNSMQVKFVNSLLKLRDQGETKALLISATGTGKTYASAFAIRDIKPKRMLFLVHREQIARQARESFRKVFPEKIQMGIISGSSLDYQSDFIFSTMQMMSKAKVHRKFRPDEFDVIVIDEVHRAGANSYQIIMDYFSPALYLGMTASPDRTDGFDIYSLF